MHVTMIQKQPYCTFSQECENIGDPESKKHVSRPESYCYSKVDLRLEKPYGLPRPYYDHVITQDTLKDESELLDTSSML